MVGGALVVATVYGTCVYEPPASDDQQVEVEPAANTEATSTETTTTETTNTDATEAASTEGNTD